MWEFVKNLFSRRDSEVTVVLLDDEEPDASRSFRLHATDLIRLAVLVVAVSVLLTTLLFFLTPIGSLYQHQQDESIRQEVLSITEKVVALQDSLELRDQQLQDLRQLFVRNPDTTFNVEGLSGQRIASERLPSAGLEDRGSLQAYDLLSSDDILYGDRSGRVPDFPAPFPIEGTVTQEFDPDGGHFGLDIAAPGGTEFRAIADGTVLYAGWTLSYGYVVYLQHAEGYLSVYKHGETLFRETGDMVIRGDLLGRIGDRGALSFGSHLHLELWRSGTPLSPQNYLTD